MNGVVRRSLRRMSKVVFTLGDLLHPALVGPRILIYHQIGGGSGLEMEVEPDRFGRQLDWMQSHGKVVSLDEALTQMKAGGTARTFVLTFDDGYRSVHERAFPELERRGLPFTLYLTTEPIETGIPLREHPGAEPLSWDQIDEMQQSGLATIGAHTHTHPDLRHVGRDRVEAEIGRSNELIAERTGLPPRHFTYPWGYWSEQADEVVSENYEYATVGGGVDVSESFDPMAVNRLPVQLSDGLAFFRVRMRAGLRWEEAFRRRLTGYTGP